MIARPEYFIGIDLARKQEAGDDCVVICHYVNGVLIVDKVMHGKVSLPLPKEGR